MVGSQNIWMVGPVVPVFHVSCCPFLLAVEKKSQPLGGNTCVAANTTLIPVNFTNRHGTVPPDMGKAAQETQET